MSPLAIRKLLVKHRLRHIEITVTTGIVVAQAVPDSFHPLVAERRQAGFAAADAGDGLTMAQAAKITDASLAPVARASAPDIDQALDTLKVKLEALCA